MLMRENDNRHGNYIKSYSLGNITVGEDNFKDSILISKTTVKSHWLEQSAIIDEKAIAAIVEMQPDLVIIGSGADHVFPPPSVLRLLMQEKIGFEIMTTATACGTFNILLEEDRNVLAALII